MSVQLRDYQIDVVERVRARVREGRRRVLLQAACGAGKTSCSSEIVRAGVAKGRRWLFLAHRRRLIHQKAERLAEFGVDCGVIMAGESRNGRAAALVASRDTLISRGVRNAWMELPEADGVIVDEAHACLAAEYQSLLARYPRAVVIGLTATPARPDGRGLGDYFDALECAVPTSRLIDDGHLVPVRCFAPERRPGGPRRGLVGDPVANWRLHADGRRTVLFAAKVAESLAAVAAFEAAGIPAEHIDAHTPDDEREAVFARVRAGTTLVLSNVGVMVEGVDVPELSCCQFLRGAGSYVLWAQACGRVMRPSPGKRDAVVIDHAGACLRHGLPTQDVEWTLDTSDSVDARNRAARKAGERPRPALCPKCFLLFTSSATCPACGHRLPRRALPPETRAELLVEVAAGETAGERAEREARDWKRCLAVAAHRGGTLAMASAIWRKEHGRWPDDTLPMPPARHLLRRPVLEVYPECVRRPAS